MKKRFVFNLSITEILRSVGMHKEADQIESGELVFHPYDPKNPPPVTPDKTGRLRLNN